MSNDQREKRIDVVEKKKKLPSLGNRAYQNLVCPIMTQGKLAGMGILLAQRNQPHLDQAAVSPTVEDLPLEELPEECIIHCKGPGCCLWSTGRQLCRLGYGQ